ncbi:MAG TPA: hypothetical protein VMG82_08085 [Candidatus Sulfotelmatobacter sp.]|nr:hypothetical protein [Candidatus Sulfotelmatobacter sp.]
MQEKTLHIDIPVKLTQAKDVFSIASLSFEGDLPATGDAKLRLSALSGGSAMIETKKDKKGLQDGSN